MSFLVGNAVVGQSGGPTSAINATLSGVIQTCFENSDKIKKLYGMKNGIEGFLKEDFLNLNLLFENKNDIKLLENTPASALGSCRVRLPKLKENVLIYEQIFEIFKKYDIRYFFYIGGNDSMDTVYKLNEYSKKCGYEIRIIGIPKTIDNDLLCTDHTPGFGSSAKYIATTVNEILRDCAVYTQNAVTIIEIMGRDAGWLTCCASIPKAILGRGVDYIYLPECTFSKEEFISSLKNALKIHPNVVVAVSEGIKYANGRYVCEEEQHDKADVFGHKYLSGTAKVLSQLVRKEIGCKARYVELGLSQRCASHVASNVDICEGVRAGKYAVKSAINGESGKMVSLFRTKGKYRILMKTVDVSKVANKVKFVPNEFINEDKNYVTDACLEYLLPLIKGERKIKYKDGIPVHFIIDK